MSGVRSSCDTVARNSSFARLADLGVQACGPFALEQRGEPLERLVALAVRSPTCCSESLALVEQVDERPHARAQHVGVERLGDVVGGARRVALARVLLVTVDGRQEDDRHLGARLGVARSAAGHLEAVHSGHLHVEQHDGEGLA